MVSTGGGAMMIDGRLLKPSDKIYDLTDVVDNGASLKHQGDQEIIVIDGRVYERVMNPGETIHDLVDVVEEGYHDEIVRNVAEIAERVARELIPDIVERIIREEITKLKE